MMGLFITFEGVEGSGKTTQMQLLRQHLEARGCTVVLTREPGGTPIAETIRDVLLDPAHGAMAPAAELLLYEAARAQHVAELIRPALEQGKIVLCDRFADSTTAYQGTARGLDYEALDRLHRIATNGVWPHLTFVLDMAPEEGLDRARERGRFDRMEQESLEFHERVRQGFLRIAKMEPDRVTIVNAARSIEDVARHIQLRLDEYLQARSTGAAP